MKRVFSGIQPTGNLHIGNYIGAMRQFIELQQEMDCVYCVVDMHSITLPQDPQELKKSTLDVAALYLSVGLDPKKSIIFVQSTVPAHAELSWILTCNSHTGELFRMTQFKDKNKGDESAPAGLLTYPLLMAADILLYDTDIVPVGNDQKQHIELTRDIAQRINHRFPKAFVVPDYRGMKIGARIMALDDPTSKMSKSAQNPLSRITLLDEPTRSKAIMKATTDSEGTVRFDTEEKPGISNLLTIYSVFSGQEIKAIEHQYEGLGYGAFKKDLVDVVIEGVAPIRQRFDEIRHSQELIRILEDGTRRADAIAQKTLKRVKDVFGLGV
ncbi:tryptophan--trna ligase mitochondrial [Holotrichia oblita]|nr:tryptophan--trna ligase mitochondrial [Holotrichia oblita]